MRSFSYAMALGIVLSICSCTWKEDRERRAAARAEAQKFAALKEEAAQEHAAFRAQAGWKRKTYRNESVLALLNDANTGLQVSLDDQRGLLMAGDLVAMDFPIASGKRTHPTPTGQFTILDKQKTYRSNLYGELVDESGETVQRDVDIRRVQTGEGQRFVGASMPYWMRLTNTGVGLHVGTIPSSGRPASHGCIRLPRAVAPDLFARVRLGTPVLIADQAPTEWKASGEPDDR